MPTPFKVSRTTGLRIADQTTPPVPNLPPNPVQPKQEEQCDFVQETQYHECRSSIANVSHEPDHNIRNEPVIDHSNSPNQPCTPPI